MTTDPVSGRPWPDYPFLEEAAAQARKASRRYWARGGEADKKYPRQKLAWKIPLVDDPAVRLAASLKRQHGGQP